jgi:phytoene dehydrogenase-like protein
VLGGALPGLVAAIRLGQRGHRVLVVEEEAAARLPDHLREPFFLGPPGAAGLVDPVLAQTKLALRDRRRLERDELAYQVVLPDARVDVGDPATTAQELVGWGLEKPEAARELLRSLLTSAQEQQRILLEAPLVRRGGLRGLAVPAAAGGRRGSSAAGRVAGDSRLATFLRAQLRALSNLGATEPPPQALGAPARLGARGRGPRAHAQFFRAGRPRLRAAWKSSPRRNLRTARAASNS